MTLAEVTANGSDLRRRDPRNGYELGWLASIARMPEEICLGV